MKNPFLDQAPFSADAVKDLGDDAIVAHATPAHEPQRRVDVQETRRSVVIRERGWSDRTVVLPKRQPSGLDAPAAGRSWLVWLLAGALAFSVGGLIALTLATRSVATPSATTPAGPTRTESRPRTTPTAPAAAAPAKSERGGRVVSVHELPVESTGK